MHVRTPSLPVGTEDERRASLRILLDGLIEKHELRAPTLWYYTPMMRAFSCHIEAACIVYDYMDELANFRFAPPELATWEAELFSAADVVFTGGASVFDHKRDKHEAIRLFPSSVEVSHFGRARTLRASSTHRAPHAPKPEPPTFGFHGVIDERMDHALLADIADACPEWTFEMIGPVVKIDPASLPVRANIAYSGACDYADLPAAIARWDVAIMPFAINDATRFISPTNTPEYLAAGLPVVSTLITDVIRRYGTLKALQVGATVNEFVSGCDRALVIDLKSNDVAVDTRPFDSWFMGGFEGSPLQFHDDRRIDPIAASGHDVHCEADYQLLSEHGIRTVRDALRWHRIERRPAEYGWGEFEDALHAADVAGTQVIWDLCHFGVPDHTDIMRDDFPQTFAAFAEAAARVHRRETVAAPWWCPINEISFWAHASGADGFMHPSRPGEAAHIKRQLVSAALLAGERLRAVDARARTIATDPLIHVTDAGGSRGRAEAQCADALEAFDMLLGRRAPELGGHSGSIDALGVNFYPHNQWRAENAEPVGFGMLGYRPLHLLLEGVWTRYGIPLLISETGAEGESGPAWLRHVCAEVEAAERRGVSVLGVCIYPVMDYPAWVDDRHCRTGLIQRTDEGRVVCPDMGARSVIYRKYSSRMPASPNRLQANKAATRSSG